MFPSILSASVALALLGQLSTAADSSGCNKSVAVGVTSGPFYLKSGDFNRSYIVHVPAQYNKAKASPLILSYHGHGKDMYQQQNLTHFSDEDINPDHIIVYPNGVKGSWQGPTGYGDQSVSDLNFTSDLLGQLRKSYCVDSSRIYASGKSNGGGFVGTLACSPNGGDFAAFAACSGAFYTDTGSASDNAKCKPARSPLPMMEFHGSKDGVISYDGGQGLGGTVPPIREWLNRWTVRNGCKSGTDGDPHFPDVYSGLVNKTTWSCGSSSGQTTVWAYWIKGMGHDWPATYRNDDNNGAVAPLNATQLIIKFFRDNVKP